MTCKDNCAANVSRITPHRGPVWGLVFGLSIVRSPIRALTGSILRHNNDDVFGALVTRFGVPTGRDRKRSKTDALAEDGVLNPAPEKVRDPKFQEDGFFDPRDIVQVKYEMLRRASVEKASVTEVSEEYGVSRPTYYQAKADFEEGGIAGLVPRKRGPRGPHKIRGEVSAFLRAQISPGEPIRARELAKSLQEEFGLDVHPRTIERAIRAKKTSR
jgi:transposase